MEKHVTFNQSNILPEHREKFFSARSLTGAFIDRRIHIFKKSLYALLILLSELGTEMPCVVILLITENHVS
jgi:hypothetical protein